MASMIYMLNLPQVEPRIETILPLNHYDFYKDGKLYRQNCLLPIFNHDVPVEARNSRSANELNAIWLRDSFGDSVTPFLMQYFSSVFAYNYRTGEQFNEFPLRLDNMVLKHSPNFLLMTMVENRAFYELEKILNETLYNLNKPDKHSENYTEYDLVPMNITHNYWLNGVDKNRPGFFVKKTDNNEKLLKIGSIIKFRCSGQHRIVRVTPTPDGNYMIIGINGRKLDPVCDGWPNRFLMLQ